MAAWLVDRFARLPGPERARWTGVLLCVALYFFHCVWFSTWLIEDAAISYAFALNAARGDGFVAYPGGEWVEGFSNPTWTLLLAVAAGFGLTPWVMGKALGVAFGAATLPLAYLWARRLGPEEPGLWPVLAPLVLATSTQFALWASSGLENGLFCLLLAGSAVALLAEGERASRGLSGLPVGLLAMTRPEGPMYAGLLALFAGPAALRAGGLRWAAGFLAASGGPFLLWHAWRYQAFAWEFPNTYYAKQTDEKFAPLGWGERGWKYLRDWALVSTHGFLLPLFAVGQAGTRGWPAAGGLLAAGLLIGVTLPGASWFRAALPMDVPAEPELAVRLRVGVYAVALVALPLLGALRAGRGGRHLAWVLACAALFFALYTGGDWMRGYRWLNMASVPLAVLAADAAREVAEALRPALASVWARLNRPNALALALVLPLVGGGVGQTVAFMFGLETSPFDVRRRVLYMRGVQDRLHLDRASLLEVDMGAHMVWSGFELVDMAGLCDVPLARHEYHPAFLDEYLHGERVPTFAHLHGGWATRTKIDRRPWFPLEYVEIPGYGHSFTTNHVGNHVRRDLFLRTTWAGSRERRTSFGEVTLEGLETPAPVVAVGGGLFVELAWSIRKRPAPFRPLLFLARGDRRVVRDLPPAYDWVEVEQWRSTELVVGRHTVSLPDDLEPGTWDLGLVVIGGDGVPWLGVPATDEGALDLAGAGGPPRVAAGEVVWAGAIEVRPRDEVVARAERSVDALLALASEGACDRAHADWQAARRTLPSADPWHGGADPRVATGLARCWASVAERTRDPDAIQRAREADFRDPEVVRVGRALADGWEAAGDAARAVGDADGAWRGWSDTLVADPTRAAVRRRLEELRAERLGLEDVR